MDKLRIDIKELDKYKLGPEQIINTYGNFFNFNLKPKIPKDIIWIVFSIIIFDYITDLNLEFLEKQKLEGWDKITRIRKLTQDVENKRNIENELKHKERLELIKSMEDSIPFEMKEIEEQLKKLMDIEQADQLQLVYIKK